MSYLAVYAALGIVWAETCYRLVVGADDETYEDPVEEALAYVVFMFLLWPLSLAVWLAGVVIGILKS